MLPRSRRVSKVYFKTHTQGLSFSNTLFTIRVTPVPTVGETKVSVIVSKKVAKSAVMRNRVRRKIYGFFDSFSVKPGFLCFVYPKKEAVTATREMLTQNMKDLLLKAKLTSF